MSDKPHFRGDETGAVLEMENSPISAVFWSNGHTTIREENESSEADTVLLTTSEMDQLVAAWQKRKAR